MQYDVFISYSRKDANTAEKICKILDREGITYFIDRKGIEGGAEFLSRITSAIDNSEVLLFLASKNAYNSKYSIKELNYAIHAQSAKVIPYIIDGSDLPPALKLLLSDLNWRTIKKCPIGPGLIQDIRNNLSHEVVPAQIEDKKIESKWKNFWYLIPPFLVFLGVWICFQNGLFRAKKVIANQTNTEIVAADTTAYDSLQMVGVSLQGEKKQNVIEELKAPATIEDRDSGKSVEKLRPKELLTLSQETPLIQEVKVPDKEVPTEAATSIETADPSIAVMTQQESEKEDPVVEMPAERIVRRGVKINGHSKYEKDLAPQGGSYKATITLTEGPVTKDVFQISRSVGDDWCTYSIDSVDDQSMTLNIQFPANTGGKRDAYIYVFMGEEEAELHLRQGRVWTAVSGNLWRQKILLLLDNPDINFDGDRYMGEKRGAARHGYGLQAWKDGTLYLGCWKNNAMYGQGIYVAPNDHSIKNLTNCSFCVSYYENGIRQGQTECYDEFGGLIYDGPMDGNQPTNEYPSPRPTQSMRFDYLTLASGAWYLGETLNGKMNGFGLYVDTDGKVWIGYFSNGQKEESDGNYL